MHVHTHTQTHTPCMYYVANINSKIMMLNYEWGMLLLLLLLSRFSCVRFCATPQMAAHQAPLSLGFSKNTGVGCHFLLQCMKVNGG